MGLNISAGGTNEGNGRRYSLVKTDDPVALNKLAAYWAGLIGAKITPVVSDEELPKAWVFKPIR